MSNRESLESALLLQIGTLEDRLSTLSVKIAGLHLRREAARVASDDPLRDRWDEEMRAMEAELAMAQQELLVVEKQYHSLAERIT